jgi:hypothetical protein
LVGAGDGGPGQDIVRIERQDAVGGFDGAVEILLGVIGLREAMERVTKSWIDFESLVIFRDCFRKFSCAKEINSCVVMIFGGLGRRVAHAGSLASLRSELGGVGAC